MQKRPSLQGSAREWWMIQQQEHPARLLHPPMLLHPLFLLLLPRMRRIRQWRWRPCLPLQERCLHLLLAAAQKRPWTPQAVDPAAAVVT